ncbi:hypothetical protein OE88DRAFT_1649671 [Heliocybe sulcata]|uniref:Uncharacterized protein n=1 Tax=Heliocybe sulcata TaxID=5364 RepID=A0A5C3NJT9_9AGAM|nr:hypothetical protein OE88DRAFT_1649671 [Heliocybe sulcata]
MNSEYYEGVRLARHVAYSMFGMVIYEYFITLEWEVYDPVSYSQLLWRGLCF